MNEEVDLVVEAFKIMALGMGIVFLFLIALSLILNIQHKIISTFFKEEPTSDNTSQTSKNHISN